MTEMERAELAHRLSAFNSGLTLEPLDKRRRRITRILLVSCLGLIPWIVFLGLTLPHRYVADHWVATWVGYDIALLIGLAVTAWSAWRHRQIVIVAALVTSTMLVVDAWFDVLTDSTTGDLVLSVITAVFGELPLAAIGFAAVFRLLHFTSHTASALAEDQIGLRFWKVPLL